MGGIRRRILLGHCQQNPYAADAKEISTLPVPSWPPTKGSDGIRVPMTPLRGVCVLGLVGHSKA